MLLSESDFVKQLDLRRRPFGWTLCLGIDGLLLSQMFQNLPDNSRVFHAGNDPYRALAFLADFYVYSEHQLQSLGPGQGGMAFGRCFIFRAGAVFVLVATRASPCWYDHCPVFAVRCRDAMKPCQVDPGLRRQSGQSRNEVQWLEDYMGSAVAERTEGRLTFADANSAREKMQALSADTQAKVWVLECSAIPDIEYSALIMLTEAEQGLRARGVSLWLTSLNPNLLKTIQNSQPGAALGKERMFYNLHKALEAW